MLARLLAEVLQVHAEHEPPPRANFALRLALRDSDAGLRWLAQAKLPAIAALNADPYVETSHLYCKGLIEPLFALGLRPRFIVLRRPAAEVARSFYHMNSIPGRTVEGRLVMLDPADPGTLKFPGWQSAGDYELCYWYALEIERRQRMYRERFLAEGVAFIEIDLAELTDWECFARLCAFIAPSLDAASRRDRFEAIVAVNQHPRNAALPGTADRQLPPDTDERERYVERAVAIGLDTSPVAEAEFERVASTPQFLVGLLPPGATIMHVGAEGTGTVVDDLDVSNLDLLMVGCEQDAGEVVRAAAVTIARTRPLIFARCPTLASGVDILRALTDAHYATFVHRAPADNADTCLFGVPREREGEFHARLALERELTPVDTVDELAAEIMCPPPDADHTEYGQAALVARLRYRLLKQSHELDEQDRTIRQLKARVAQLQEALEAILDVRETALADP